jgi:adenylylsulfate kinase
MNNSKKEVSLCKPLPGAIWISGITASGKSTLGKRLYEDLVELGIEKIEFFDGDELRKRLDREYGHSLEEREKIFPEILKIILASNNKGNIVIVSTIIHKRKWREIVSKSFQHYMEVYLKCPVGVCAKRDYKGHYQKGFNGEYELFVGVTEPYEESVNGTELVLDTFSLSIEACSKILLSKALNFLHFETYLK